MEPIALRLFADPPRDGPTNMAIDECLLDAVAEGGPPTLRLYRWEPATLSLGYFQRYDDPARGGVLAELPVVRRVTGGGAIVHADELTYSLALPIDHRLTGAGPEPLYVWMHERIAEAVTALGGRAEPKGAAPCDAARPFLCFRRHACFDLMTGPQKIAGSAQRRTKGGVLQHGSVVLRAVPPIQPGAGVGEAVGRSVSFEAFAAALVSALTAAGVTLGAPTESIVAADALARHRRRHTGRQWLRRR